MLGSAFSPIRNVTVPSPCPSWPPVIDIHEAVLVADHEHSRATLTATVPVPPAGPKFVDGTPRVAWQRVGAVGDVTLVSVVLPHAEAIRQAAAAPAANCRAGTLRAIIAERKCTTFANLSTRMYRRVRLADSRLATLEGS